MLCALKWLEMIVKKTEVTIFFCKNRSFLIRHSPSVGKINSKNPYVICNLHLTHGSLNYDLTIKRAMQLVEERKAHRKL